MIKLEYHYTTKNTDLIETLIKLWYKPYFNKTIENSRWHKEYFTCLYINSIEWLKEKANLCKHESRCEWPTIWWWFNCNKCWLYIYK